MSTFEKDSFPSTERLYANCLKGFGLRAISDRKTFIEWLRSLPRDTEFGRGITECPLARFSGHEVGYVTYGNGSLPDWAAAFVLKFIPPESYPELTVDRALAVMRRIK